MRIASVVLLIALAVPAVHAQGVTAGPLAESAFAFEQLTSTLDDGSVRTRNGLVGTTRGSLLGGIVLRMTSGRLLLADFEEASVAYFSGAGSGLNALPSQRLQFALGLQAGVVLGGETQLVARAGFASLADGFSGAVPFYTGRVRRGPITVEGTLYSGDFGTGQSGMLRWYLPVGPRGLNAQVRYLTSDVQRAGLLSGDIAKERSLQLGFGIER